MLLSVFSKSHSPEYTWPRLIYDHSTTYMFSPGYLSQVAQNVSRAVFIGYLLGVLQKRQWSVEQPCNYQIQFWRHSFANLGHTFVTDDVRFMQTATWFAAFLLYADAKMKHHSDQF